MNKTPLHNLHQKLNARIVDFEGWKMPLQYEGILPEHHHTRAEASIFDTCHMTEYVICGPSATDTLRSALACRIQHLEVGECGYGFLLNCSGGVIDDLICYRKGDQEYLIVANASTHSQVSQVLQERISEGASFEDVSEQTAKIDLQGPRSADVLYNLWDFDAAHLDYFTFTETNLDDTSVLISRTGYTGELGFELYVSADEATHIWEVLLGHEHVEPAGLGARDTLRLEMGYPLYGHELDESISPVEANLSAFLPSHSDFFGYGAIEEHKQNGPDVLRVGIRFEGRRAARPGDEILMDGEEIGCISSGAFSPTLECAIALGYVDIEASEEGQPLTAAVRSHHINGTVTELPFYDEGTAQISVQGE